MTEQTPLETLTEMNHRVGRTRKRPAQPVDASKKVERFYRLQLQSLVKAMAREVRKEVLPVIKEEAAEYTLDAHYTRDTWADRIIETLSRIMGRYTGETGLFQQQYERMAARTVSMAEAESTGAFLKSVNKAVGVDLEPVLNSQGMSEYLTVATRANVDLIKSVPQEYFDRIENAVLGGVRGGQAPAQIARNIREATGVSERRARLLARDQSAKLTSEITERRQSQSGIQYYRSSTAGDERVTGKPGGKYPNAKISCWGISQRDIGYGKGVYTWKDGAEWGGQTGLHPGRHHNLCRCSATPVFNFELPKDKQE